MAIYEYETSKAPAKTGDSLTVAELIERLRMLSPTSLVVTEGCDCYGAATGASACRDEGGNEIVVITR